MQGRRVSPPPGLLCVNIEVVHLKVTDDALVAAVPSVEDFAVDAGREVIGHIEDEAARGVRLGELGGGHPLLAFRGGSGYPAATTFGHPLAEAASVVLRVEVAAGLARGKVESLKPRNRERVGEGADNAVAAIPADSFLCFPNGVGVDQFKRVGHCVILVDAICVHCAELISIY